MNYSQYKKYRKNIKNSKNCSICNLQTFESCNNKKLDGFDKNMFQNLCFISDQITFYHKKIIGWEENDKMAKPLIDFHVDNSKEPWKYLTVRYNQFLTAHRQILNIFCEMTNINELCVLKSFQFKPIDTVKIIYVNTVDKLNSMISFLKKYKQLAINLMYHSLRSFLGFTWLIQISTGDVDYYINALILRAELHVLNLIFMDPYILKIFYHGKRNVLRLQKDFCIFVVNIFNIELIENELIKLKISEGQRKSISNIISFFDSKHTHFLLYLKVYLANLFPMFCNRNKILKRMRNDNIEICKQNFYIPLWNENDVIGAIYEQQGIYEVTNKEFYIAKSFYEWRDEIARKLDESPNYILSDENLIKKVKELISDYNKRTTASYKYVRYFNGERYMLDFYKIIMEAMNLIDQKIQLSNFSNIIDIYESTNYNPGLINSEKLQTLFYPFNMENFSKYLIKKEQKTQIKYKTKTLKLNRQLIFKNKIDVNAEWKPKEMIKPNALVPLNMCIKKHGYRLKYCHPYKAELLVFETPCNQLTQVSIQLNPIQNTPLYFVNRKKMLKQMMEDLENYNEIAIDIKYNLSRSYLGYTSLILISTRDSNYIIDALMLQVHLRILNQIFTKPTILKVMHKSSQKMLRLQKDFSFYFINIFDTAKAAKKLHKSACLTYLKKYICKIKPSKTLDIKNWRFRPLSSDMLCTIKDDTHYLLFIKDSLSNELFDQNQLQNFYNYCTSLCKMTYNPNCKQNIFKNPLNKRIKTKYNGHTKRINVIEKLREWRNKLAQKKDENVEYILSNRIIIKLADKLPKEKQILKTYIPHSLFQYLPDIHKIINESINLHSNIKFENRLIFSTQYFYENIIHESNYEY